MFSKLKQFKDLRSQAKIMQNALAEEKIQLEHKGINIELNGNMEIIAIKIDENLDRDKIAENMRDAVNNAIKKAQKIMAQKMQEMGGLGNLGL